MCKHLAPQREVFIIKKYTRYIYIHTKKGNPRETAKNNINHRRSEFCGSDTSHKIWELYFLLDLKRIQMRQHTISTLSVNFEKQFSHKYYVPRRQKRFCIIWREYRQPIFVDKQNVMCWIWLSRKTLNKHIMLYTAWKL